jgi:hypothetical protein
MSVGRIGMMMVFVACSSGKDSKIAPAASGSAPPTDTVVDAVALKVSGIEPTTGTADGEQIVVIRGQGFNAVVRGVKVYFGTKAAAVDRLVGDVELHVATPAGKEGEVVDVRVIFEPGGEMTLAGAFTYGPPSGAPLVAAADSEAKVVSMSAVNRAALLEKLSALETRRVLVDQGTAATGALTREEIDKVIKSRAGLLRACYQKELERKPSLQGKVVVSFAIGEDGKVTGAKLAEPATTLDDEVVTSCIVRQFQRMLFPARGAVAKVTYPLIFSKAE